MSLSRFVIGLVIFGFTAMGLVGLLAPDRVLAQFGILKLTTASRNEVRAVYGGFGLAMALALGVALTRSRLVPGVCATLALALAGMVLGRLASALVDRAFDRIPLGYGCIEATGAALLFWVASLT